jgi:electron transport complex protein RnfA
MGVVLQNTQNDYNFIESLTYGLTGGIGFLIAIVLFASIRERLEFAQTPKSFEGFPIALVTASLLSLAFMGFSGLKIW